MGYGVEMFADKGGPLKNEATQTDSPKVKTSDKGSDLINVDVQNACTALNQGLITWLQFLEIVLRSK